MSPGVRHFSVSVWWWCVAVSVLLTDVLIGPVDHGLTALAICVPRYTRVVSVVLGHVAFAGLGVDRTGCAYRLLRALVAPSVHHGGVVVAGCTPAIRISPRHSRQSFRIATSAHAGPAMAFLAHSVSRKRLCLGGIDKVHGGSGATRSLRWGQRNVNRM